jgi:hypothetical protein
LPWQNLLHAGQENLFSGLTALTAEFTVGEGKLMTHDEPCSMAPDDKHDLISGTCSHLPRTIIFDIQTDPMILERRPRIHIRFKAASTKQGTSITDVIKDLVDNWLKENDSQKTQMSKNTLTQKHTYPYREH